MKRFEIIFADGHVETINADECGVNGWSVYFAHKEERDSRAWNAKPGDITVKLHTFRIITGRLISEVREIGA